MRMGTPSVLFTKNPLKGDLKRKRKKKAAIYKDEKESIYSSLRFPAQQRHFVRTTHSGAKSYKFPNSSECGLHGLKNT